MQDAPENTPQEEKPKRSFLADLVGALGDITAPIWRGAWDKRYYRAMLTASSVTVFSFLVAFVALGWFARMPVARADIIESQKAKVREVLHSTYVQEGKLHTRDGQKISIPIDCALVTPKNAPGGTQQVLVVLNMIIAPQDDVSEDEQKTASHVFKGDHFLERQKDGSWSQKSYAADLGKGDAAKTGSQRVALFGAKEIELLADKQVKLFENELSLPNSKFKERLNMHYTNAVITELVVRLMQAILIGAILWALLKNIKIPFPAAIRLAIVAMAPGLFVNLLTDLARVTPLAYGVEDFVGIAQIPFWVLTVCYIVYARKALAQAPQE